MQTPPVNTPVSSPERNPPWAAYAAAVWSFAFAAVSVYWALGGEVGIETVAADITRVPLANDRAVVWGTALLKGLAGLLALAMVQLWEQQTPRRLVLAAGWLCGALLTLYGLANLVDHGRMVAGLRDTPQVLGERAARWHLFLWDPVWLLGGILFLAAAWQFARKRGS